MKLEQQIIDCDPIDFSAQHEVKKAHKFLGKLKLQRGQSFYELNTITKIIKPVTFESAITLNGKVRKKFTLRENCFYVPALNIKNAEKKFLKLLT